MVSTFIEILSAKNGKLYVGRVNLSLNSKYRVFVMDKMS